MLRQGGRGRQQPYAVAARPQPLAEFVQQNRRLTGTGRPRQ
jgi:hypothetical protein